MKALPCCLYAMKGTHHAHAETNTDASTCELDASVIYVNAQFSCQQERLKTCCLLHGERKTNRIDRHRCKSLYAASSPIETHSATETSSTAVCTSRITEQTKISAQMRRTSWPTYLNTVDSWRLITRTFDATRWHRHRARKGKARASSLRIVRQRL